MDSRKLQSLRNLGNECEEAADEIDRLRAEVEALRSVLTECADDLAAEIQARASGELPRRIERDLEPVRKARELLAQPAGPWVNPLAAEVEALRRLLFNVYTAPGMGYTDDGELQDGTVHPSIDFLRMTPEQIQEAIKRREGKGGRLGELAAEVEKLRAALSQCATAVGASAATDCSVEFLACVPREVELVVGKMTAQLAAERAASVIEWEPGRSYTAAELLRRAIRGIRGRNGRSICPAVENLFGCGNTVARHLCRWAGRDPDTGREIAARKGEGVAGA